MFPFLLYLSGYKNVTTLLSNILKRTTSIGSFGAPWDLSSFTYLSLSYQTLAQGGSFQRTWQLTIICGLLLAPLFYELIEYNNQIIKVRERISWRSLATSSIMIFGVILVQIPQISNIQIQTFILSVVPLVLAPFVILWVIVK